MTTATSSDACARAWEIEAMRDGRLRGNDAESMQRHLKICSACAAEHTRIEDVGRDLRGLPAPQLDALAGRRIRQRLLMDHNEWMLRRDATRSRWRRPLALLAACAALSVGIVGFRRVSKAPAASVPLERGPTIEVLTAVNAHWRRESWPDAARIALEDGEIRLKIQRWRATDRVTIALPDGVLEDLGTVLDVTVSGGQTQEVRVDQGSVIVRLRGEAPQKLTAGQSWHRTPARAVVKDIVPQTPAPDSPERKDTQPRQHHDRVRLGGSVQRAPGQRASDTAELEQQPPSTAETQVAKAEDEAYLRLVALLRDGRVREAREAARDYLLRFPTGFRRLEVLNIATHSAP